MHIREIAEGPAASGIDIVVTGPDYGDISSIAETTCGFDFQCGRGGEPGIQTWRKSREEVAVSVNPAAAAAIGLNTRQVGAQLNQLLVGRTATAVEVDGEEVDVFVTGDRRALGGVDAIKSLVIVGPAGSAPLGELAETFPCGKVQVIISRTDGRRSATITGDIITDDTQQVGGGH